MCPTCIPAGSWGTNNPPKGLLPVCFICEEKYSSKKKDPEEGRAKENDQAEIPAEDPAEAQEVKDPPTEKEVSPDSDVKTVENVIVSTKVCRYYEQRRCKHGRTGEGCNRSHPKLCFGFENKGPDGCPRMKKKEKCQFHHPTICKFGDDFRAGRSSARGMLRQERQPRPRRKRLQSL